MGKLPFMSLDNLTLSPLLIQELYENSLVDFSDTKTTKIIPSADQLETVGKKGMPRVAEGNIKYLGNNAKNILILIDEADHAFLPDAELNFLISILEACKVNFEDSALVNCHNNIEVTHENLNRQFSPAVLIFLGTEPQLLGFPIQIPQYKVQQYNHQQYMCAPALGVISADKEAKKQLWNALKILFSIY